MNWPGAFRSWSNLLFRLTMTVYAGLGSLTEFDESVRQSYARKIHVLVEGEPQKRE